MRHMQLLWPQLQLLQRTTCKVTLPLSRSQQDTLACQQGGVQANCGCTPPQAACQQLGTRCLG